MKRTLTTVKEIVAALGGTARTAEWAGVGMSAVSNWLADEDIPAGWHYRLHLELEARGFSIDPAAFGIRKDGKQRPKFRAAGAAA